VCGRFALDTNPKIFADHFNITGDLGIPPSWNIAPSTKIHTITSKDSNRYLRRMKWGLIPSWADDPTIGNKFTVARGETVAEKPSFKTAFKYHRCIIPASGFFEWKAEGGIKTPWYISLKSKLPMAFAGLWQLNDKGSEPLETCCIITTNANSLIEPIIDRMPVILSPDLWELWLSPHEHQKDDLLPLIKPFDSEPMQAWQVTRELNKVGVRNDAGLTEPIRTSLF
jgi:putative SOS response-associated peptidase YedK